jgi:predicted O-linked N-acetylglucosamine transferase (SPINDLY family)
MAQLTIQQAFELALQHHQAGRVQEAEQLYRRVLAQQPEHIDAMHNLGVLAHQTGRNSIAVDLIRRAIVLRPDFAEAHSNFGSVLTDMGQLDEAIAACRQAIALKPNLPGAHSNLGNALRDKGQVDEAITAYRQAIALRPNLPEAHCNLGNVLRDKGQLDEAIASLRQALAYRPNYAEAQYDLGNALRDKGQLDEAMAAYGQAISLRPKFAEAHNNLGGVLMDKGQVDEAIAAYRQAIIFNCNLPEAQSNLGIALKDQGQLDEAVAAYRQAIALRPDFAEAHSNLGIALADQGRLDEAIAACRQAIALKPNYAEGHSNLIFTLHYHPAYDAQAIAEEQRRWNRQHAEPLRKFIQSHCNDLSPDRRLRIGYVSPDFRDHAVGRNLLPLFQHHDRRQFEITCYAHVLRPDAMTRQFQQNADGWRNVVGLSDEQAVKQIREDRIDFLVDLALHTAKNRLLVFARKPAPVQATFAGYPGSTGLSTIDYRLSDPYLDPPEMDESVYSERTIRLPDSFWCYDPLDSGGIPVNSLPAQETGVFTFGCLNKFFKLNEMVLALWARVMRQVENSRLLLLAPPGSHRQRILDRFSQEGIASARIEFAPRQSRAEYLKLYHRIDLGLDSFPYNGHTTSLDAFWMGVPVVTLVGQTVVGRAGLSQLTNLGLPELIARTPDQYVQIVAELAGDLPRLAELRRTLRARMEASALMDGPRFARNVEAAYRQMWRIWCARGGNSSLQCPAP